jgi:bifunctional non-homologous end joining protein LigD
MPSANRGLNLSKVPALSLTQGPALSVTKGIDAPRRPVVAGVGISHPDRVLFPDAQTTKLDLARYYESIGDWILPHVVDRPLTLVRCPTGVGAGSFKRGDECFFMKHSKVWAPPALRRVRIREKTKIGEYLIADSLAAVVGLVQMDILEIHTWNSCFARVEQPDRIVIDLDPGEGVEWPSVVAAARLVRELLSIVDLESFVKTTGGRGLHVVVPLTPSADWSECLDFARAFAQSLVRRRPDMFTERFGKAGRQDKILVDYLRNNRTNTSIAAYSTRARPSAPVSVPLAWSELSPTRLPARFTIHTVPARLARLRTDPWKAYWRTKQRIRASAVPAIEGM